MSLRDEVAALEPFEILQNSFGTVDCIRKEDVLALIDKHETARPARQHIRENFDDGDSVTVRELYRATNAIIEAIDNSMRDSIIQVHP